MKCRLTHPVLLLGGLCLIHLACCTTIIPLCESGNCTTALVRKKGTARPAKVRSVDCAEDKKDYCFRGQCQFILDLNEFHCRCQKGYVGERCMNLEIGPVSQPLSEEYVVLTVVLSVAFVTVLALGAFFAYKWYRSKQLKKQHQSKKVYMEVNTCSE
ncbi:proepiregulin [Lissotriton helveticus]